MNIVCLKCKVPKPKSQFYKHRGLKLGVRRTCIPCYREHGRVDRSRPEVRERMNLRGAKAAAKRKQMLFEAMGGKCTKCGFDDHRALCIDHIKGDGKTHRYGSGTRITGANLYRMLLASPEEIEGRFQLLCCNCNQIKKLTCGEGRGKSRLNVYDAAFGVEE